MQTSPSRSTRFTTTVPALAAVLVTAMLVSMAMATGTAPRLTTGVAMHAMLLGGTGQTRETVGVDARTPVRTVAAARPASLRRVEIGGHAVILASLASGPARGDLPPPARG
jgi:hypothetical protein